MTLSMNSAWPGHPQDVTTAPKFHPPGLEPMRTRPGLGLTLWDLEWPAILSSIRRGRGGHHLRDSLDLPAFSLHTPSHPCTSTLAALGSLRVGALCVRSPTAFSCTTLVQFESLPRGCPGVNKAANPLLPLRPSMSTCHAGFMQICGGSTSLSPQQSKIRVTSIPMKIFLQLLPGHRLSMAQI